MSSSEPFARPDWIDLQVDVPPPAIEDFTEQSEFDRIEVERREEVSPDQAYRNGLAEGEQQGRAAAMKELEPVIEELRTMALSLANARQQRLDDAEAELVQVASEISRKILRGELTQGEDVVLHMARACIEQAKEEGTKILHVSPSNLETLRERMPELELDLADSTVEIRPNSKLDPGCVVLETPQRCYDGRPERILREAEQQLEAGEDS